MIRFAKPSDHPRLKALFAHAFGDPEEAVNAYFALRHKDENMLVDERDGTVTGMLSMLPVTLCQNGKAEYRARYIYAVATDARYRGRGIGTALLKAVHAYIKSLGEAAAVLSPASPSLFRFYEDRGYRTAFWLQIVTINAGELPPFPIGGRFEACPAKAYAHLRDRAFQSGGLYVRWDESAVSYALRTFAQPSGVTALSWAGGSGCAAWETADGGILVKELALAGGDVREALSVLHEQLKANRYAVRLAEGTLPGAQRQPFGMIRWLVPEPALKGSPPYLSLAMD